MGMVSSKRGLLAFQVALCVLAACALPAVAQTAAASAPAVAASVAEASANPYGLEALWGGSDMVAKSCSSCCSS